MFANRFTAFVDACSLASALKRKLLLSLAEAEFFRLRWSSRVLHETEAAIEEILSGKGFDDATTRAQRARASMESAFEDAMVTDFDNFFVNQPFGSCNSDACPKTHVLESCDPAQNMARFYVLTIEPILFGDTALLRERGRLGQPAAGASICSLGRVQAVQTLEAWFV